MLVGRSGLVGRMMTMVSHQARDLNAKRLTAPSRELQQQWLDERGPLHPQHPPPRPIQPYEVKQWTLVPGVITTQTFGYYDGKNEVVNSMKADILHQISASREITIRLHDSAKTNFPAPDLYSLSLYAAPPADSSSPPQSAHQVSPCNSRPQTVS